MMQKNCPLRPAAEHLLPAGEAVRIRAVSAAPEGVALYASAPTAGQSTEPRWKPWRQLARRELPAAAHRWLLDEGSLTGQLVAASAGRFAVRVLEQRWLRPLPSERRALALRAGERALVREVLLECDGEPWVYARSVAPVRTLNGPLRHLRRFGERSLGALLFADPGIERGPFELARVSPGCAFLPRGLILTRSAWARRRSFALRGRALLVQEVFLPACRLGSLYSAANSLPVAP
jgi:chorismate--pyruvate lyase